MDEKTRLRLKAAQELAEKDRLDDAYKLCEAILMKDPNQPDALVCMQYIMMAAKKQSIAYHLGKRCVELLPNDAIAWMNAGMACADLYRLKDAERMYKRGMQVATLPSTRAKILTNWAATLIDHGRFEEAERKCNAALAEDSNFSKADANLGFCQLALRKWKGGWRRYRQCIGSEFRPRNQYKDEPEWDGKGRGTIVVYGEQGLGDVIAGGSMLPDMIEWCKANDSTLIVEVDKRLEGLFKRSFPEAIIYGTRESKDINWEPEHQQIDYSIPMLQLAEYFRNKTEDFPGTAYLKPDPDRALMWRSLFQSKGKPVIGIAWRGGIPRTASRWRQMTLEQLYPILSSVDAHWVSLQYRDSTAEIEEFKKNHPEIDIVEYPHCTESNDYDDTAAMVSVLDQMVIMQTTVGHLAGALEIPCWTFVPISSQWRYGPPDREDFVWCKSVRLLRQKEQGEWDQLINKTAGELSALFPRIPEATGKATREGKLRRNGQKIRPTRKRNHRQAANQPSA